MTYALDKQRRSAAHSRMTSTPLSITHIHTRETHRHKQRTCVRVRVIPGKASSRRARQCGLCERQIKRLCGTVGSPATARPLPDRLHQPTPPKSVCVDFKNGRTQSPPARAQKNMCRRTRRSFCATARIFRGSAETSSPGKPLLTTKTRKIFDGPQSLVRQRECAAFNARFEENAWQSNSTPSRRVRAPPHIFVARARTSASLRSREQAFRGTADERGRLYTGVRRYRAVLVKIFQS